MALYIDALEFEKYISDIECKHYDDVIEEFSKECPQHTKEVIHAHWILGGAHEFDEGKEVE